MRSAVVFSLVLIACGGSLSPAGDAGADAKTDAGGDASACTYGPPTSLAAAKTCTTVAQCTFILIPVSCCKDIAYGVVTTSKDALANEVGARTASCPACGCAAQPEDELGNLGVDFAASCDNGKCVAHAK